MFKEFGLIFVIFIVIIFILQKIGRRNAVFFGRLCIGVILGTTVINVFYNLKTVYPTFIYEGVPIGDSEENLFVYKKDSHFPWHILNTISSNRVVYLDKEGDVYEQYFNIFSDGVERVEYSDEVKKRVLEYTEDFEDFGEMFMLIQLDFAFPQWDDGARPRLYINVNQLEENDRLVVVAYWAEEQSAMYVMAESYLRSIMK